MARRRAVLVALAAASLAGCGGSAGSSSLYDQSATMSCLEQRPEFVKTLEVGAGTPLELSARTGRYVHATRVPGTTIPAGTRAISVKFNDAGYSALTALLFPKEAVARRIYGAFVDSFEQRQPGIDPGKVVERHRNAVFVWTHATAPPRVRGIVAGCLRAASG